MDEDQTKEVKLVIRSLACTRMELHHSRLASSAKLRAEFDRRLENNTRAVDSLNGNRQLWLTTGGPDPDTLGNPTELCLERCAATVQVLKDMLQKHGPKGGLDSFVEDIEQAVKRLKVVTWEAIRKDCFSLTPLAFLPIFPYWAELFPESPG